MKVDLAVLFWFYKDPLICENRLRLLRRYNPAIKVFGLYGGPKKDRSLFETALKDHLDDFYCSPFRGKKWKWLNGDMVILDWYKSRGKQLKGWDSVCVIQWDMLVLGSLTEQFADLNRGETFLSARQPITEEIEKEWYWTKPNGKWRKTYEEFLTHIKQQYNYRSPIFRSIFMLQVLPRIFFESFISIPNYSLGFFFGI